LPTTLSIFSFPRAGVETHSRRASVEVKMKIFISLSAIMNWTLARTDYMIAAKLRYFVAHAGAWERENG
jgi:hypothetical protein